jgi:DNA-binding ferritin-like protein
LPAIAKISEEEPQQERFKYPNYLSRTRSEKKSQNPEERELAELKKVMDSRDEDEQSKLRRARDIIDRMNESSDRSGKKMINIIKAKIDVINHFNKSN